MKKQDNKKKVWTKPAVHTPSIKKDTSTEVAQVLKRIMRKGHDVLRWLRITPLLFALNLSLVIWNS